MPRSSDHEVPHVAVLREQLAAERPAHAEARRIIAGLVERIPPQLEARESSETAEEASERAAGAGAAIRYRRASDGHRTPLVAILALAKL